MSDNKPIAYVGLLREVMFALRNGFIEAGHDPLLIGYDIDFFGDTAIKIKNTQIYISVIWEPQATEPSLNLDVRDTSMFTWKMTEQPADIIGDIITWYVIYRDNFQGKEDKMTIQRHEEDDHTYNNDDTLDYGGIPPWEDERFIPLTSYEELDDEDMSRLNENGGKMVVMGPPQPKDNIARIASKVTERLLDSYNKTWRRAGDEDNGTPFTNMQPKQMMLF